MRLEQLIQPQAGDRLSFEFGEELEIETPILYAEDDNIVVGADDKTVNLFCNPFAKYSSWPNLSCSENSILNTCVFE